AKYAEYIAMLDQFIRHVFIINACESFSENDNEPVPIMLVGNKCDKITEREVSREEEMDMAIRLKINFIKSSARKAVNVERAFYGVVKMIRQNREGVKILQEVKRK
ncbi:5666_t:CDS:2, partial [Dentiscutata erythropus]